MVLPVVPWHLGPLHPVEQALTLVLAFGPFVLLAVVIVVRRRQDRRLEEAGSEAVPTVEDDRGQRDR